jgi:hypothetical protein
LKKILIYFAALISQNCDMYLNRIKWLLVTLVIDIPNYIERYKNDMVLSSNRFKHYKNYFTVIIVCCTKGTKLLNIFICSLFLWAATVDDLLSSDRRRPVAMQNFPTYPFNSPFNLWQAHGLWIFYLCFVLWKTHYNNLQSPCDGNQIIYVYM